MVDVALLAQIRNFGHEHQAIASALLAMTTAAIAQIQRFALLAVALSRLVLRRRARRQSSRTKSQGEHQTSDRPHRSLLPRIARGSRYCPRPSHGSRLPGAAAASRATAQAISDHQRPQAPIVSRARWRAR